MKFHRSVHSIVCRCLSGTASRYLARELQRVASSLSATIYVIIVVVRSENEESRITIDDRVFSVADCRQSREQSTAIDHIPPPVISHVLASTRARQS